MTCLDSDANMMNLPIAVADLITYIKKHKNPYHRHLQGLSENMGEEVEKLIKQNQSLHEKVKGITDDLKNCKLQLHIFSKSKDDLECELQEVRHKNLKYEHKWQSIVEENRRLNEMAEQLEKMTLNTDKNEIITSDESKECCQLNTHNKVLENELKKKEGELNIQETQRDKLLNKLKESEEQVILMQKRIQELERDSMKYNQTITDMERQFDDQKEHLAIILSEKDRNISKLKETNILSNQKISDLKDSEKSLKFDQMDRENHISILNDKLKKTLHIENDDFVKTSQFCENEIARKDKMLVEIKVRMNQMEVHAIALENELKERDAKIDALNAQVQHFHKHKDEYQEEIERIKNVKQKMIIDLKKDIEQRDAKINSLEKRNDQESSKSRHQIDAAVANEIGKLNGKLKLTISKLHDTEAELCETKTRLRKAIGDRLRDNDTNVTDLSDRNRPTKLAEKCAELYDNQWRNAFEILDKYNLDNKAVIVSLLHILKATMTFCEDTAKIQMEELGRVIIFADTHVSANLPYGVQKQLKNTRQTVALSAVENIRKMFISYLKQSTDQTMQKAFEIKEFTFACLELCWFMMVNTPPVVFAPLHAKGSDFKTDLYKPYSYGGTHIDYVVWPALLLHEGGPVLAKGVAQGYNT